jgi:hypothetical protein
VTIRRWTAGLDQAAWIDQRQHYFDHFLLRSL